MARLVKGRINRRPSTARRAVVILGLFFGGVVFLLALDLLLLYGDFQPFLFSKDPDEKTAQSLPSPPQEPVASAKKDSLRVEEKIEPPAALPMTGIATGTGRDPFQIGGVNAAQPVAGATAPQTASQAASKEEFTFYQRLTRPVDQSPAADFKGSQGDPLPKAEPVAKRSSGLERKYTLQVGSFAEKESARRLVSRLSSRGYSVYMMEARLKDQGIRYRVRVGSFGDKKQARALAERLEKREGLQSFVAFSSRGAQ